MKKIFIVSLLFLSSTMALAQGAAPSWSPEQALNETVRCGEQIKTDHIRTAAVAQNGRIKAFATFTRETVLFILGKFHRWGLDSSQLYLAFSSCEAAPYAPVIEVRDVELRKKLGFTQDKRYFSLADLESSQLESLATPLMQKEKEGTKLNEKEKKIMEAYSQMGLFRQIALKQHLPMAMDFSWLMDKKDSEPGEVGALSMGYLELLSQKKWDEADALSQRLHQASRSQKAPDLFQHYLEKLDVEVWFFDYRPFLWASVLSLLFGLLLTLGLTQARISDRWIHVFFGLSLLPVILGLGIRVYVTQFAPITNMYGTMIWVAFGVTVFSWLLYGLYKNKMMSGLMLIGSGLILLLTENIPLILSPDMDPIVAVLRSNFWLSTHVTTITISYAAFTIAMILGNVTLVKMIFGKAESKQIQDFFHYSYRMVQLGCFLLTVGIILGGVWADYSWGRFWGWDPKETWALIADMGFLVLLHARYVGWVTPVTFLSFLPVSYLLVIMAWYGVNFILAAGLHSYGFSSGGATAVGVFVTVQMALIVAALARNKILKLQEKS